MTPRRVARCVAAVALAAQLLAGGAVAAADRVPSDATWEETWFASGDGTMLHADVFLPARRDVDERHPVILSVGPYFGTAGLDEGPVLRFQDLMGEGRIFERGYAYVQVDLRGTGGSEGCYDLGGPGEQMDVKAAVEWAATQEWSTGKVAMWGKSYDAWTQVMALAMKPRGLATAVIQAPLSGLYPGLYMNGISYGWYDTPAGYGIGDLTPPSLADSSPQELIFGLSGVTDPGCYAENLASTLNSDASIPYYRARDLIQRASATRVPTLWSHGFLDANTKPDNFVDLYPRLRGPKRAWVGQFDHVRGNQALLVGRMGFMREAMDWLDHYLRGKPLRDVPDVEVQDNEGKWRSESQWPPADATRYELELQAATYVDIRGNDAWEPDGGAWTFTQPAPYDMHIAGEPRLTLDLEATAPSVNTIALLYDVAPDGRARLLSRGASVATAEVEFDLYPQDWRLRARHRLGIQISGADESWFSPISSGTSVEIAHGALSLPFLRFLRPVDLEGLPAAAMTGVPVVKIDRETIAAHTNRMRFPPRLRPSN